MKLIRFRPMATLVLAFTSPLAVLADISSNATLNSGQNFNFDTGLVATSGGDIQFTATSSPFRGARKVSTLPQSTHGSVRFSSYQPRLFEAPIKLAPNAPIPAIDHRRGQRRNGHRGANQRRQRRQSDDHQQHRHFYQLPVHHLRIRNRQRPRAPTITYIQNNSSLIPVGFSNPGISPSSIFKIHGTGMATPGTTPVLQTPTATTPIP